MKPGTPVLITSRCTANGRTGVVTAATPFWAGLGFLRVTFDPKPPFPAWGVFPAHELSSDATVRGPAQASLFGGGL